MILFNVNKMFDGGIKNYEIIGTTTKNFDRQILKYGVYLGI